VVIIVIKNWLKALVDCFRAYNLSLKQIGFRFSWLNKAVSLLRWSYQIRHSLIDCLALHIYIIFLIKLGLILTWRTSYTITFWAV